MPRVLSGRIHPAVYVADRHLILPYMETAAFAKRGPKANPSKLFDREQQPCLTQTPRFWSSDDDLDLRESVGRLLRRSVWNARLFASFRFS